jgi:hypothetical protein
MEHRKMMVTIARNPLGFHLLEVLSQGRIFATEYSCDNILTTLIQFLREPGGKRLVLCAENRLRPATHPPDSPNLAPSDSFLFGHVKNRFQGIVFQSQEELLAGTREVLDESPVEMLEGDFEH